MKHGKLSISLFFLVFVLLLSLTVPVWAADGWTYYKQGVQKADAGQYDAAIPLLEKAVSMLSPQPALYNKLATTCEKAGQYQKASENYRKQGNLCLERGGEFVNEGYAALRKADELNSEIELYTLGAPAITGTLQKYEPSRGIYIGAYLGDSLQGSNAFSSYNTLTGKKHATFFGYVNDGSTIHGNFSGLDQAVATGAAVHIAYLPMQGLSNVSESQIRAIAQELKALQCPVFFRYAGEMNGDWVPWHGDPTTYIQNWRTVTNIMRQEAPNVAMVWSPSEMPLNQIESYYPGDDYVDWIGLSVYNKRYANGDINQPMDKRNSLEAVDYVYQRYSARKPIMISEYGAGMTVEAGGTMQDTSDFAVQKMTYFYESLRLKYPRVKCIQYFNGGIYDNRGGDKGKVNYSMLDAANQKLLAKYKEIIADEYFLSTVVNGPNAAQETQAPQRCVAYSGGKVTGDLHLECWAKTYDGTVGSVVYKLNGARIAETYGYPFAVDIPYAQLKAGNNTLEAVAFDGNGNVAIRKSITLTK